MLHGTYACMQAPFVTGGFVLMHEPSARQAVELRDGTLVGGASSFAVSRLDILNHLFHERAHHRAARRVMTPLFLRLPRALNRLIAVCHVLCECELSRLASIAEQTTLVNLPTMQGEELA